MTVNPIAIFTAYNIVEVETYDKIYYKRNGYGWYTIESNCDEKPVNQHLNKQLDESYNNYIKKKMAKPKHRETLFTIVRTCVDEESGEIFNPIVCGVYTTLDRAEEVKGQFEQEVKDTIGLSNFYHFNFEVQPASYYDE